MSEKRAKKSRRRRKRKDSKRHKDAKRQQRPKQLKMYIDESGNSGSNIFDQGQPSFFSLGLLSPYDLTTIEKCSEARIKLQVGELHGSELGLTRISSICSLLIDIVQEYNLMFLCSEINKIYFGKMKFFDVIFDSGTNPGVGAYQCFVKPLKFLLMIRFAELVTYGELKHFWTAYSESNVSSFTMLMENMAERVDDYDTDASTKELLLDCYRGAASEAKVVLGKLVKEDSPNVSSIVMFIHELHKLFDGQNVLINEVVHDTQQQFGRSIEEFYRILHQVRIMWNIAEWGHKQVKVFSPTFYTCDSKSCDGLQMSDVILYLHKQARSKALKGEANSLYQVFQRRLHCLFMTKEGLWSETEAQLREVYSKPFTAADCKRAAQFLEQVESKRKARLLQGQSADIDQSLE